MKKSTLIAVLSLIVLGVAAWFIVTGVSKQPPVPTSLSPTSNVSQEESLTTTAVTPSDSPPASGNSAIAQRAAVVLQSNNSVPAGWKTYTNTKWGFAFQYPDTWFKDGDDANVTNLKGNLTEVDIQLRDSSSKTAFLIIYHLAPNGASLYSYAESQFKSSKGWYATGAKEIRVAGNKALVSTNTTKLDGRGLPLTTPLKTILVDVLDKEQTGEFQFQFQTPAPGADKQEAMFYQLLSSFKFTK